MQLDVGSYASSVSWLIGISVLHPHRDTQVEIVPFQTNGAEVNNFRAFQSESVHAPATAVLYTLRVSYKSRSIRTGRLKKVSFTANFNSTHKTIEFLWALVKPGYYDGKNRVRVKAIAVILFFEIPGTNVYRELTLYPVARGSDWLSTPVFFLPGAFKSEL